MFGKWVWDRANKYCYLSYSFGSSGWQNCARKPPSAVNRPTAASSLTVQRRLLKSADTAPTGSALRDESKIRFPRGPIGYAGYVGATLSTIRKHMQFAEFESLPE